MDQTSAHYAPLAKRACEKVLRALNVTAIDQAQWREHFGGESRCTCRVIGGTIECRVTDEGRFEIHASSTRDPEISVCIMSGTCDQKTHELTPEACEKPQ